MKHPAAIRIAVAFALLTGIPPAFADNDKSDKGKAQGKPAESEDQQMKFKGMDTNHDGRISRAEWRGNDQSFSNHDLNHDGYISGAELGKSEGPVDGSPVPAPKPVPAPVPTPAPNPMPTPFATLDRNKDGKISQLEWNGTPEAFKRLDLSHDGVLGPKEYAPPSSPNPVPVPVPSPAPTTFATLDRNKDGKISQLEWNGTPETFKRLDVNHDGVLGPKEFASDTPSDAQLEFAKLDLNKDGKISQLEWNGTPETFKRLDDNHDGVLGPKEFASGTPSAPGAPSDAQLQFAKLDVNKDGKISQLEWNSDPASFKYLDANHDGVLGPKEFSGEVQSVQSALRPTFGTLDVNKDGKISSAEWKGDAQSFSRLDVNRDGWLSPQEYAR
jgi:Ca2+-binding EF-hand superfamily protein